MTIGVVGAGAMGAGIAQVAAQNGHEVILYDTKYAALESARHRYEKIFARLVEKGKWSQEKSEEVFGRIHFENHLDKFEKCGLIIEAIIENLDVKKSVFNALEDVCSKDCVLATNTSSLSIAAISSAVQHPERILGVHFFNPAPLMPLVEIIPALTTDMKVVENTRALVDSWGKVTVEAKDTPGFIVNRVARPFYSEAIKMYEEGVADFATIDWALREIGGFRMGPFELTDLIGHDVNYVVTETVWTQFYYDPRFKPSITQKRLLEAGLYGRKSGRGFYNYNEEEKAQPTEDQKLGQFIVDRIVAMLINEAADALFLNIASAEDIDLAMTKGVNYPKGLLAWADEIGIETVVNRLNELYEEYQDDRYRTCPLLRRMLKNGTSFFS
ncbi:MAG: 3-hydroxyacyl-CoA dehydrogenase NAD-binding domain-containing protein [Schleiferiaceae bacterium]|nr:3-hydroxyacyl-CoA dehydrogenase NAD-binding domain-containing protein [Schleiferiaceae bacterium]